MKKLLILNMFALIASPIIAQTYVPFEWTGVAGVGQASDNELWLVTDSLPGSNGDLVGSFLDLSPNANSVTQNGNGNKPTLDFSGPNGHKQLVFAGNDRLNIADDIGINMATYYTGKNVWITFTTGADVNTRQMLYEQGGGTRGLNIYIEGGEINYHIWNKANDNGSNSKWGVGTSTGAVHVQSSGTALSPNQTYIAMLQYSVDNSIPAVGTLQGFLNGANMGVANITTPSGAEPWLYKHPDNGGIGGANSGTKYHDNTGGSYFFTGAVQEVIHLSEAPMNSMRRALLDNYLATKYDITLVSGSTVAYDYGSTHSGELAGIGRISAGNSHHDAQGSALVRIHSPADLGDGEHLLWAHDNVGLSTPVAWGIPNLVNNAMHRVWRADERGDVGTVDVEVDLTGWAISSAADVVMLIDSDDGNFVNANVINVSSFIGNTIVFSGVNLADGDWFTFGSLSPLTVLPIELVFFEAELNGTQVDLSWATATELNNDYFTIERSSDGQSWERVTAMDGAGNSNALLTYSAVDHNPLVGTSFYRLKQTDYDGHYQYSLHVPIYYAEAVELEMAVFPNPFTGGQLNITLQGFEELEVDVTVVDIMGRILYMSKEWLNGSPQTISLNDLNLNPGTYFVQISDGVNHTVEQLIKE